MPTLTGPIKDLGITDLDDRGAVDVTVISNAPGGAFVSSDGALHLGSTRVRVTGGVLTIPDLPDTSQIENLRLQLQVDYMALSPRDTGKRKTFASGWFEATADLTLADVVDTSVPNAPAISSVAGAVTEATDAAEQATQANTDAQAAKADAEAARDEALTHTDLLTAPATTVIRATVAEDINDPESEVGSALNGAIGRSGSVMVAPLMPAGGTPAQNATAITNAIASAVSFGADVCFDSVVANIDSVITISSPNVRLWCSPGAVARLTQTDSVAGAGKGVFTIAASGVTIDGFEIDGNNPTLNLTAAGTTNADRAGHAGIRIYGGCNGVTINRVKASGFWAAVAPNAPDGATPGLIRDLTITNLTVSAVWGAVLSYGTVNLTMDRIKGTYVIPTVADPVASGQYLVQGHLIYCSLGDGTYRSALTRITNCHAYGGRGGVAYNLRAIDGLYVDQITAYDCTGLMDYQSCTNAVINGWLSEEDKYPTAPAGGGLGERASIGINLNCDGMTFGPGRIRYSTGDYGAAFYISDSTNIKMLDPVYSFNLTTSVAGDGIHYAFRIIGTSSNIRIVRPKITSSGAAIDAGFISAVSSIYLDNPELVGTFGQTIRIDAGNPTVTYDPDKLPASKPVYLGQTTATARLINTKANTAYGPEVIGWHTGEQVAGTSFNAAWPSGQRSAGLTSAPPFTTDSNGTFSTTSSPSGRGMTANFGTAAIDLRAEVKIDATSARYTGFMLHAVDNSNWLGVGLDSTGVTVWKNVAGTETSIATAALTLTNTGYYDLRVTKRGSVIDVWVDGAKALSYTLVSAEGTTFNASTNHGLFSKGNGANGRIRAIRVRSFA